MTASPTEVAPVTLQAGSRFSVHGADSTGEVTAVTTSTVSYRFDHAPETEWSMKRSDFHKITHSIR